MFSYSLRRTLVLFVLFATAIEAAAQGGNVFPTIGPDPAPIGCPVAITVSNDAPFLGSTPGCPYRILDTNMNEVFDPGCPEIALLMGPWGWATWKWNQVDNQGQQVPPGNYWVEVRYDVGTPTLHRLTVGGEDAGMVLKGTPAIFETLGGESRAFYLCSPQDPGEIYLMAASLTANVGFSTCGGTIPLDPDALFVLSLTPNTVFSSSVGFLNGQGRTETPTFDIPENPNLVGQTIFGSFLVLDPAAACVIRRIAPAYEMTFVG